MHREKFPEKIPFRLTRMLTHAMEVSGIEGSFRNTCEISMKVLRENKESLMAVLEAFVYDPLINWRLMQPEVERREGTCALRFVHRFSPIGDPPSLLLVNLHFGFSSGPFPNCWVLTCALHILGDSDRAADLVRAAAYPTAPIRKLKADENDILNGTSRDLRAIAFEGLTNYSIQRRRKSGTNAPCLCTDGYKISSPVRHPKYGYPSFRSSTVTLCVVGRDFNPEESLSVSAQVDKLILQATSLENLCQCFSGWYVVGDKCCRIYQD